uniref:Shell matrix protein hic9 n=1 Tax=Sinohyriopsis cumingii TaxID=165450 RepID=A0A4Y1NZH7_SINCU|nr:shell matrix protein hic9 [Sinohyriopsis cumingii]
MKTLLAFLVTLALVCHVTGQDMRRQNNMELLRRLMGNAPAPSGPGPRGPMVGGGPVAGMPPAEYPNPYWGSPLGGRNWMMGAAAANALDLDDNLAWMLFV